MGYNSVKNMPRKQQKAVFARMGKDKYLDRLEGAEKYHRRRQYLIQRKDLEENTEDKIFQVMNNKALTHRQKMVKIAEIKKAAAKKLSGHKATEESQTIVSEIREGQKKRFAGQEAENRKKLLENLNTDLDESLKIDKITKTYTKKQLIDEIEELGLKEKTFAVLANIKVKHPKDPKNLQGYSHRAIAAASFIVNRNK